MTWLCTPQRLPCYRDTRLTGYTGRTGCTHWKKEEGKRGKRGEGGRKREKGTNTERGIINYNKIIIIITIIYHCLQFHIVTQYLLLWQPQQSTTDDKDFIKHEVRHYLYYWE